MNTKIDTEKLNKAISISEQRLLQARNSLGFWEGYLSSSAVSTSVAIFALWKYDKETYHDKIILGINWLCNNINTDGGWGDSPKSETNLSSTLLTWSALSIVKDDEKYSETIDKCESWLRNIIGNLKPNLIIKKVISFYGNDRTFSVPILMFCTLAGRLGEEPDCWNHIPQLPFELAQFPHQFYKFLNLNVVSYALPALIAMGLVKYKKTSNHNFLSKAIREKAIPKVMNILETLQPEHGGFLEAAPLTGFVTMSLASTEFKNHVVTQNGIDFLTSTQREDGSWPIDTNLATWVTTLSIKALLIDSCKSPFKKRDLGGFKDNIQRSTSSFAKKDKQFLTQWLLDQQFQKEHYFTHSPAGGWGWTNLYGGAPDADDTSGALVALLKMYSGEEEILDAARKGIFWLLKIQNSNGGIPTFCKGWGKLPFDQSCPDLTAHAIQAMSEWKSKLPSLQKQIDKSIKRMIKYLSKNQHKDGYWLPLWFGNQWNKNHENPIYGTAMVGIALQEVKNDFPEVNMLLKKASKWLFSEQNNDNGWGNSASGNSTIEETSLALQALITEESNDSIISGSNWLIENISDKSELTASPIGLYFASLWYSEKMYPMVYSLAALKKIIKYNK